MDFIEILAFIIGLVYFIMRANRKSEKEAAKKVRPSAPSEETESGNEKSLEDIFREIIQQQTPAPKVIHVEEPPQPQAVPAGRLNTPKRAKIIPVLESIPEEVPVQITTTDFDFDLKQAVIYDAILNRPYS